MNGEVLIRRLTQIFADYFWGIAADFPITAQSWVVLAMRLKSSATGYESVGVQQKISLGIPPKNLSRACGINLRSESAVP